MQVQLHGPLPLWPVTGEAVPAAHRLVVGSTLVVTKAAEPQAPLPEDDPPLELEPLLVASQPAVVPPLLPAQVHVHPEEPSSVTAEGVPTLHRLVVGALLKLWPLADPQAPFTGAPPEDDEPPEDELLVVPLLDPLPDELLPLDVPLLEPELLEDAPLLPEEDELPDEPLPDPELLDDAPELDPEELELPEELEPEEELELLELDPAFKAVHCAVLPPLLPLQLQFHGPLPLTGEAVPALHRPAVGLLLRLSPFAGPQAPFTGFGLDAGSEPDELPVVPLLDPPDDPLVLPEPDEPELLEPDFGTFCSICWISCSSCRIICSICCNSPCSICSKPPKF